MASRWRCTTHCVPCMVGFRLLRGAYRLLTRAFTPMASQEEG